MTFLVWVYASQDFAQTQPNFAQSRDYTPATFRSCDVLMRHHICFGKLVFLKQVQVSVREQSETWPRS